MCTHASARVGNHIPVQVPLRSSVLLLRICISRSPFSRANIMSDEWPNVVASDGQVIHGHWWFALDGELDVLHVDIH